MHGTVLEDVLGKDSLVSNLIDPYRQKEEVSFCCKHQGMPTVCCKLQKVYLTFLS